MDTRKRLALQAVFALLAFGATALAGYGGRISSASPSAARLSGPLTARTSAGPLILLSTQFTPVEEAEKMRRVILAGFPGRVQFVPEDLGPFNDRIRAEARTGHMSVSVLAGLHGDFAAFAKDGLLEDVSPLLHTLHNRGFPSAYVTLSRFGSTDRSYYIPWVQATYIMAVNKKALPYLPKGAKPEALTYDQLAQWGANIHKATGRQLIGFPAGPNGLMHRFFQGYLYPSYTGSAGVVGFKSPAAVRMWTKFKALWSVVNPQSTSYEFMQEPLLSGEVWIAWDHTARLIDAARQRPRDFLIDYLTQPKQQVAILQQLAFFPATNATIPSNLPAAVRLEAAAVKAQASARDARPSLLPVGLGAKSGEFNKVYLDTMSRIVLNNEPVQQVLNDEAKTLQAILNETKAPCWAPDPPSRGPCHVK
jgi:multiple sugar transport system substrate-binding protein